MDVILLEKVQNLGKLGDRVTVRNGYARNYLLPQGKAAIATAENVAEFEARRAALEKAEAEALGAAQARADALEGLRLVITAKSGGEGKLFGSIGTTDIAAAAVAAGHQVERREVQLPEGPFRQVGEYEVTVRLHPDVNAAITVSVEAEEDSA
ncbi:MAG TPA: 50S ribosomal protein L9 [Gammaproteobacteria bacterium]|nr:50S ribosomal protein L9 [Gammaproteobacteria bacterium]